MSPSTIESVKDAQLVENAIAIRKQLLLRDPHFVEGNQRGLEEEARGEMVPLEDLRAKYGRH